MWRRLRTQWEGSGWANHFLQPLDTVMITQTHCRLPCNSDLRVTVTISTLSSVPRGNKPSEIMKQPVTESLLGPSIMLGSGGTLYEQWTKQTRLRRAENFPHLSNMMEEERWASSLMFFRKLRYMQPHFEVLVFATKENIKMCILKCQGQWVYATNSLSSQGLEKQWVLRLGTETV